MLVPDKESEAGNLFDLRQLQKKLLAKERKNKLFQIVVVTVPLQWIQETALFDIRLLDQTPFSPWTFNDPLSKGQSGSSQNMETRDVFVLLHVS